MTWSSSTSRSGSPATYWTRQSPRATAQGVVFLTAAGNSGKAYYSHAFHLDTGAEVEGIGLANAYDFNLGTGTPDYLQRITVTNDGSPQLRAAMGRTGGPGQLSPHAAHLAQGRRHLHGGRKLPPTQQRRRRAAHRLQRHRRLLHRHHRRRSRRACVLKYKINNNGKSVTIHDDNAAKGAGDISGHRLNPDEITVGEIGYQNTPAFGHTGDLVNSASSDLGPGQYLFDAAGNRLVDPPKLGKPDVTGAVGSGTDVSGTLNGFSGTSAAAPNVAGVVALMLQANGNLSTAEIKAALQQSALPMEGRAAGAGLVQAPGAVLLATVPSIEAVATTNLLSTPVRVGGVITLTLGTATPLTVTAASDGRLPTLTPERRRHRHLRRGRVVHWNHPGVPIHGEGRAGQHRPDRGADRPQRRDRRELDRADADRRKPGLGGGRGHGAGGGSFTAERIRGRRLGPDQRFHGHDHLRLPGARPHVSACRRPRGRGTHGADGLLGLGALRPEHRGPRCTTRCCRRSGRTRCSTPRFSGRPDRLHHP